MSSYSLWPVDRDYESKDIKIRYGRLNLGLGFSSVLMVREFKVLGILEEKSR